MNITKIHRTLFKTLLIGGTIIAALSGGIVSVIEHSRINRQVARMSLDESRRIANRYERYHRQKSDSALAALIRKTKNGLDIDRFVMVEFLNEQKKLIARIYINNQEDKYNQINAAFAAFTMPGRFEHQTVHRGGQMFIKVMMPIFEKNGNHIIGHFQGLFHLADDEYKEIRHQIYYAALEAMIVSLLTVFLVYPLILSLHKKLASRSMALQRSNTSLLKSLGSAVAERDSDTNAHNFRVTIYSVRLAEKINLDPNRIRALIKGAFLHDIGKIGISDTILLKPGKLLAEQFATMKQHVAIGVKIVQHNEWLEDARDVIQYHHEKYDGSGYLSGLKGSDIPINARIFAICDVFDALTSKRPYKNSFSLETSLKIMKKEVGSHFDPDLFAAFEQIAPELYEEMRGLEKQKSHNQYLGRILADYFGSSE